MKVLFVDTVHPILSKMLSEKGCTCLHMEKNSFAEIAPLLPQMEGLVIRSRFPVNKDFLRNCPALKFIARSGAGMENIDLDYCQKKQIRLFNSPEGNRNAVGEHALGLLLSLLNNLPVANKEVKNGIWAREKNRGVELDGKTVGIIGYGNNGEAFAKKLAGFDVKILAYDKYKSGYSGPNVLESNLDEIYKNADVISFHVPQNNETIGYFNSAFLNQMKQPFYLLNISRGKVVQSSTVVQGLKSGKIRGAGLDVLDFEDGSFENLEKLLQSDDFQYFAQSEKVILSPHVAGWTIESYQKLSFVLGEKIIASFML